MGLTPIRRNRCTANPAAGETPGVAKGRVEWRDCETPVSLSPCHPMPRSTFAWQSGYPAQAWRLWQVRNLALGVNAGRASVVESRRASGHQVSGLTNGPLRVPQVLRFIRSGTALLAL